MATRRETQEMARRPGSGSSPATRDPYGWSGNWPDPFNQFRRWSEQMDRWFDSFGVGRPSQSRGFGGEPFGTMWAPQLETFRRNDEFVARMDLPGLKTEDVNVEVTDDSIVIHGERQHSQEEDREGWYRSERSYGRFYREVPLPDGAQTDTARANFRDGVLEITVKAPQRDTPKSRRIEIGSSPAGERSERKASAIHGTSVPSTERSSQTERPAVAHDRTSKGS